MNSGLKQLWQTLAFVAAVAGVIFLVAFVRQFSSKPTAEADPSRPGVVRPSDRASRLVFPQTVAGESRIESEIGTRGHYDFWFRNDQATPVELGLASKSCNCTQVKAAVLSEAAWRADAGAGLSVQQWFTAAVVSEILAGSQPHLGTLAPLGVTHRQAFEQVERLASWETLNHLSSHGVTVPAGGVGVVRLDWKADLRAVAEQRLLVDLWQQPAASERVFEPRLEALVTFSPAVRLSKTELEFQEPLTADATRSASFFCWSASRLRFPLDVTESTGNPCFEVGSRRLSDADCRRLEEAQRTRVLSGYEVTIVVHERRNGSELDLGPFRAEFSVLVPGDNHPHVAVVGTVSGFLEVNKPIEFPDLYVGQGPRDQTVTLRSDRAGLQLEVVGVEPEPLQKIVTTELTPVGPSKQAWLLTARIEPGKTKGLIPEHGVVIVRAKGETSRRIRVPIHARVAVRPF